MAEEKKKPTKRKTTKRKAAPKKPKTIKDAGEGINQIAREVRRNAIEAAKIAADVVDGHLVYSQETEKELLKGDNGVEGHKKIVSEGTPPVDRIAKKAMEEIIEDIETASVRFVDKCRRRYMFSKPVEKERITAGQWDYIFPQYHPIPGVITGDPKPSKENDKELIGVYIYKTPIIIVLED